MKSRKEIKSIARQAFQTSYWPCVGALVLYGLITYALSCTGVGSLILGGPILIGFNFYFINVFMHGGCDVGGAFSKAFEDFGRKLGGYLWMQLFLFLWALIPACACLILGLLMGVTAAVGGAAAAVMAIILLVTIGIGGTILVASRMLAYALTPYFLSDCPNVRAQDALTLSKRVMRSHRWELFVFYLSFIGWDILSAFTCGILSIFYVGPWKQTALAGWYLERREQALREGSVTADELNGGILRENTFSQSSNSNDNYNNNYNSGYNNYNNYNPGE